MPPLLLTMESWMRVRYKKASSGLGDGRLFCSRVKIEVGLEEWGGVERVHSPVLAKERPDKTTPGLAQPT
jgi:hypothetical protein